MDKLKVVTDSGGTRTEAFPCPFCGRDLVLWPERFKGSGTRIVRTRHLHNNSGNCNAPEPTGSQG